MKDLQFIVPCLFGLEGLAGDELRRMDMENVKVEDRRVLFTGDAASMAKANICLRTGERVLILLGTFRATTFEELFEGTRKLAWERFIPDRAAFPVKGYSLNSKLFSVSDAQKLLKKAVIDKRTLLIFLLVLAGGVFLNISPVWFVILAALAGIFLKNLEVKNA